MKEEKIYILINDYLKGTISSEDKEYLDKWLTLPDNKILFDEVKLAWNLSEKINLPLQPDIDKEWLLFKELKDSTIATKKIKTFSIIKTSLQAAAILIACVFVYFLYNQIVLKKEKVIYYSTLNKKELIHLPDGSSVWLNKNSALSYSFSKNNERITTLKGEGYFVVAKDSTKPFIVEAENTKTRVLGTIFNLRARQNDINIELSVIEGRVSFSNDLKSIILTGGEQGVASGKLIEKKEFKEDNVLSWKNNTLKFTKAPIGEIIPIAERFFNVKVIYPEMLNSIPFSGSYNNPSLNEFFTALTQALNLEYKFQNDTVIISTARYNVTESGAWEQEKN